MITPSKQKKIVSNPIFDMFAVQPTFFINGKENHTTVCGCIMTVIYGLLMAFIFGFYFYYFLLKSNFTVSMTSLAQSSYPEINLYKNGFFIAVAYKEGDKLLNYKEIEETGAKLDAFHVTIDYTSNPPTVEREKLDLEDCDGVQISKDSLKGESSIFNKDSRCLEFSKDFSIYGSESSSNFSYIEIRVETCDETSDKCISKLLQDKSAGTYQAKFDAAYQKLREISLRLSFLDVSADTNSFDSPLIRNINSNHYLQANLVAEKYQDYFFGTYEVNTVSGWLTTTNNSISAMFMDTYVTESTYRDPTYGTDFKTKTGTESNKKMPYGKIRIMTSNKKVSVERKYETLVDVFGTVGGIAETLLFVFLILTVIHQGIRLEQKLLNEGLLLNTEDEREAFGTSKKYKYWEIFCYKFFGFCRKKEKRYKDFNRDIDTMQERLDIRRVISNTGNLNVMANIFLDDYQMKLIPFLNKGSEDKDVKAKNIGNKEALYKAREEIGKNDYQKAVDSYILKHLDKGFLDHYDDGATLNLRERNIESEMNGLNNSGKRIEVI